MKSIIRLIINDNKINNGKIKNQINNQINNKINNK